MSKGKQQFLHLLTQSGKPDGRSTRWQKTSTYAKLARQGKFGGSIAYRVSRRPLATNKALHVVLKSEACQGKFKFTNPLVQKRIEEIIKAWAKKKQITLYKVAIVSNHIHLLIRTKSRALYAEFIRALSCDLAKKMQKWAKKLNITYKKFWEKRPFSRVIHFGRDFKGCMKYLTKNTLEAMGFVEYTPRNHNISKIVSKIISRIEKQNDKINNSQAHSTA